MRSRSTPEEPDPWPPTSDVSIGKGRPERPPGGVPVPPERLVAAAAVLAASLATAGSMLVLVFLTSEFGVTLGERLRAGTTLLVLPVPVLLLLALLIDERGGHGQGSAADADGGARRLRSGVAVVALVVVPLLVGRLLADMFAAVDPLVAGEGWGWAGRVRSVLVDLGGITLAVSVGWWAWTSMQRWSGGADDDAPAR